MVNEKKIDSLLKLKKGLPVLALRSGLIQGFFTPARLQGIGFGWALLPFIKRMSETEEEVASKMKRHFIHFNGNPYLASVALGAAVKMEAEGDVENVNSMKRMIMVSSGAVGDQVFWQHLKPLMLLLAVVAILLLPTQKVVVSSVLFGMLLSYGIITWWVRFRGVFWGWHRGKASPVFLVKWPVQRFMNPLGWTGAFFSGILLTYSLFGQFNLSEVVKDFPVNPAAVLLILMVLILRNRVSPAVMYFIALSLGLISSLAVVL